MKIFHKDYLIVDYVFFVVVVVIVAAVVVAVLAFVVVTAAEFDVVISADVAAVVFHLVVVLVLFVVAAVASDFENDGGDFAAACYFLEIFADYFGELDDVVESTVCRLHLTVLVDLAILLLTQLSEFPSGVLLNRSLPRASSVENKYFPEEFLCCYSHVFLSYCFFQ